MNSWKLGNIIEQYFIVQQKSR